MKYSHTIADELTAAGFPGAPVSWGEDGVVQFPAGMPSADKATIQAVFDAHDPLPGMKTSAIAQLNERAEQARQRYITPGAGKAMVYEAKRQEAVLIVSGGATKGRVGFAEKRAARKGMTLAAVGAEWQAKAARWTAVGATIEDLADGAADQILALTDPATFEADAGAIINSITWPTPV